MRAENKQISLTFMMGLIKTSAIAMGKESVYTDKYLALRHIFFINHVKAIGNPSISLFWETCANNLCNLFANSDPTATLLTHHLHFWKRNNKYSTLIKKFLMLLNN